MKKYTMSLKVFLEDINALAEIKKVLGVSGKGRSRISVILETNSKKVEITLPKPYSVTAETIAKISTIKGVRKVSEV